MSERPLIPLRPVVMGANLILEGQPYTPADARETKKKIASGRWRPMQPGDQEAWDTRLARDPALQASFSAPETPAADGAAADAGAETGGKGKGNAKSKAEADEKAKAEAEAKAKMEADSKPGASIGPGGIG